MIIVIIIIIIKLHRLAGTQSFIILSLNMYIKVGHNMGYLGHTVLAWNRRDTGKWSYQYGWRRFLRWRTEHRRSCRELSNNMQMAWQFHTVCLLQFASRNQLFIMTTMSWCQGLIYANNMTLNYLDIHIFDMWISRKLIVGWRKRSGIDE